MTNPVSRAGLADTARLNQLLDRFEQAWQRGSPPRIDAFIEELSAANGGPARLRAALKELVLIDLSYRWRVAASVAGEPIDWAAQSSVDSAPFVRRYLEDYVQQFPLLAEDGGPSTELIGEEYRVRHCWGDRPSHEAYLARFPRLAAELRVLLPSIDAELTAERPIPLAQPVTAPEGTGSGTDPGTSVTALVEAIRSTRVLGFDPAVDATVDQLCEPHTEPRALANELVRRGCLTPYQANQLLGGHGPDLAIGAYVILEPLGQGGTGQVFKARHQRLERTVALKVIRKELLSDPEVVTRFYREIRLVSQLSHPHIVHALDAGPVGVTHYLVMEYVKGTDLSKLVKRRGPLRAEEAVEYVRQAALGLQYIHENRLVHRDIKPGNLIVVGAADILGTDLLTGKPSGEEAVVKILDLGLARQQPHGLGHDANRSGPETLSPSLTPAGSVMVGTPDYLAPEQALDFHAADIRADLYSLGCTFFYLLTGHPPFPGDTLTQKLLHHQQTPPPGVESFRSDVPPGCNRVIHRLMAKRPEDRYQTPTELVADLQSVVQGGLDSTLSLPAFAPRVDPVPPAQEVTGASAGTGGRPARRHRLLMMAGFVSLVAIGTFGWFAGFPPAPRQPPTQARRAVEPEVIPEFRLWDDTVAPADEAFPEEGPVELGVKFRTDVAGKITALRFFKGATNTGPHVGHLWDSTGKLLATVPFRNETSRGWQRAVFPSPVPIKANTVYVASYHTPVGHYACNRDYFTGRGVDRGPLHALADGAAGGNGVFHQGASAFPAETHKALNYWVDLSFVPDRRF